MNGHIAGNLAHRAGRGPVGRKSRQAAALAFVFVLAGCSQVPDWVNPVNWVDGMFDGMFNDEVSELPPAPKPTETTPGADKPFPKLGQTQAPERMGSSAAERKELADSLVADRDNAKYSNENLRAGDRRLAAAPPQPIPLPTVKSKPMERIDDKSGSLAAVPTVQGTEARSTSPSLPAPPAPVAARSENGASRNVGGLSSVPSIVQRRGGPPPPPPPIAEVSRRPIPRIVQNSKRSADGQQMSAAAALPQPPAPVATAPATASAPTQPAAAAPLAAPKLIPPAVQSGSQVAAADAAMVPSVQVNLPLGQDQSVLAQTFAASLAAQGSRVVQQPANVFNAPGAAPIGGQWSTVVPSVVQQAFDASLDASARGVPPGTGGAPIFASPQMSNDAMRRLPGAPALIRFGHGSVRLSGKEKKYLRKIAEEAKNAGKMVYVVGHASQRTGDMDYAKHKLVNFNLSLDRANVVAGELRRRGIAADRIVVQAKGDAEPLYFEFMPDGEAQNRRVEIYVR